MSDTWPTAITSIGPNEVRVRGYDIAELMGRVTFGAGVYLVLRGELPSEPVGRLMDAVLVSSIDHGVTPPSCLAARTVASTGAGLSASVAAGVMSINRHHGGAIQGCAEHLRAILDRCTHGEDDQRLLAAAEAYLAELKARGQRMPGFGHRIHTDDPRASRLLALAEEAGAAGPHARAARAVAGVLARQGKSLPINVDGAMAAVLADLGFGPSVMNGLFMIARVPGLVAHAAEEQARMKPMRRVDSMNHRYDGPPPRRLQD